MSDLKELYPQALPILYSTLVELGFNSAANGLLKDSKQPKEELVKKLDPKISILEWFKTLPKNTHKKEKKQTETDSSNSDTSDDEENPTPIVTNNKLTGKKTKIGRNAKRRNKKRRKFRKFE